MHKYLTTALAMLLLSSHLFAADLRAAFEALERGDTESARALFEAHEDDSTAQLQLAILYMGTDPDTAEDWIDRALASDPDNPEAHFVRGNIMGVQAQGSIFSAMGYARQCKQSYQRAVELDPTNTDYLWGLMQFHLNAPAIAGGDMEEAEALVEQIGSLDREEGFVAKLEYQRARGEDDQFETTFKAAQAAYPDSPQFYFHAGIYYQQKGDFASAFDQFTQASKLVSDDEDREVARYNAIYQIGRTALFSEQNIPDGIEAFKRYIDEAPVGGALPDKSWANFRLGNLYQLAGREREARLIYVSLQKTADQELEAEVSKSLKQM